jgi:hypothetical protein
MLNGSSTTLTQCRVGKRRTQIKGTTPANLKDLTRLPSGNSSNGGRALVWTPFSHHHLIGRASGRARVSQLSSHFHHFSRRLSCTGISRDRAIEKLIVSHLVKEERRLMASVAADHNPIRIRDRWALARRMGVLVIPYEVLASQPQFRFRERIFRAVAEGLIPRKRQKVVFMVPCCLSVWAQLEIKVS